ncbi:hypothetical protein M569_05402, partial [Genlisea aurea]
HLKTMARKAVLIGCNYGGTKAELRGCINDVRRMYACLVDLYGFSKDDITVLTDAADSDLQPTGRNIRQAITDLIGSASPGDILFVHYSGHGTRLPAETGEDDDTGYDECIVPTDMNLITDDDFRGFVNQVPEGCQITIVSDSCHSGGLIDEAKEQIGNSTKQSNEEHGGDGTSSSPSFRSFLKKTVEDALGSRGIDLGFNHHHHHHNNRRRHYDEEEQQQQQQPQDGENYYHGTKNRSLPLSTLIQLLQEKTGKQDIDVGHLRPTLFDIFGDDASPKVKKFMNLIFSKLNEDNQTTTTTGGGGGGFVGMVGGLALQFLQHKLEENDQEDYLKPALQTPVGTKQEAYAGSVRRGLPDSGILISGCQSDQTSADANPSSGEAYGALSNAIQTILTESDGKISNRELVIRARELLKSQGFTQQPGLYCSDYFLESSFVC